MDQIKAFGQHLRLRPFAAALDAHDDVFVHWFPPSGSKRVLSGSINVATSEETRNVVIELTWGPFR
jgi:hypothetical protein